MRDLTKGNSLKLIIRFAIPLLIGHLLQLLYGLIDLKIIGNTLGDHALAAVGATAMLNELILAFTIGTTLGFSVISAQYFGACNLSLLKKSIIVGAKLCTYVSIIIMIIGTICLTCILELLNIPSELTADSAAYIRIIILGTIVTMFYNFLANLLRAIGDVIVPLIFLVIAVIVNIVLDYYFIVYIHTGVKGAAWATVIAQVLSVILCYVYIKKKYDLFDFEKEDFVIDKKLQRVLLTSGMSMGFMESLCFLGSVILQSAVNALGTNVIVGHTAARKLTSLFMLPFTVLGATTSTYCSQNLGARKIKRIWQGVKQILILSLIWCVLVVFLSFNLSAYLVELITNTKKQQAVSVAILYLKVNTACYIGVAIVSILRNALQGIEDRTTPIISSFVELVGKVVIVMFLTPRIGYMGVVLSEPIIWVFMCIILIVKFYTHPIFRQNKLSINNNRRAC